MPADSHPSDELNFVRQLGVELANIDFRIAPKLSNSLSEKIGRYMMGQMGARETVESMKSEVDSRFPSDMPRGFALLRGSLQSFAGLQAAWAKAATAESNAQVAGAPGSAGLAAVSAGTGIRGPVSSKSSGARTADNNASLNGVKSLGR